MQTEENTEQFLECIKKQSAMSRNRTRKPKHSSITSLPLWLYSGYMLLQKSRLMEKYGSVRYKLLNAICLMLFLLSNLLNHYMKKGLERATSKPTCTQRKKCIRHSIEYYKTFNLLHHVDFNQHAV